MFCVAYFAFVVRMFSSACACMLLLPDCTRATVSAWSDNCHTARLSPDAGLFTVMSGFVVPLLCVKETVRYSAHTVLSKHLR